VPDYIIVVLNFISLSQLYIFLFIIAYFALMYISVRFHNKYKTSYASSISVPVIDLVPIATAQFVL